jgi:thiol-disulfide isomerase/thioredoxin
MNATSAAPPKDGKLIWIIVGVVVVVAGIAALVVARGSGEEKAANQTGSVEVGEGDATGTTIEGAPADALPVYDAALAEDPAVGMTIPAVTGTGFDGEEVTIEPGGDAKILMFVAHWCPHCQDEVPRVVAALEEEPLPEGVELITVSTSVKPGADNYPPQDWLAREGVDGPILADDEDATVAATYGLSAFPYFVVVDSDGKVVARASGELSTEQFAALVDQAEAGAAA